MSIERIDRSIHFDRMATVTRHRRASVGRPSAGAVGRFLRPAGSPLWPGGPTRRGAGSPLRPSWQPDLKRDRDAPSTPAALPRSPPPRSRLPCRAPPFVNRRATGEHTFSNPTSIIPTPMLASPYVSPLWGLTWQAHTHPSSARGRAGVPPPPVSWATWLILPVAYACLKD